MNERYRHFKQEHYTAGDEDQFEINRYGVNNIKNSNFTSCDRDNMFASMSHCEDNLWFRYKNLGNGQAVTDTFRYLFYKFKKGIFIKIKDNSLAVFLPFSNVNYTNEWHHLIKVDPCYISLHDFINSINIMSKRSSHCKINTDTNTWFANNYLVRYEYPVAESDTNIACIKHLFETLCQSRSLPDIEFFVNKRDFPLLKRNLTEPYNHIWGSPGVSLVSHQYEKYAPVLSMTATDEFADIIIPTHDDWAGTQVDTIVFPRSRACRRLEFNTVWETKIPCAIFRGSSTGEGVTVETNTRLKATLLSMDNKCHLDAGITSWNIRPRKFENETYLRTIDITSLPFGLSNEITPENQSNFKYVLHIDGHVASFRLGYELGMGSVLLIVESSYRLWYSHLLVPYRHFVPVKKDLSNLLKQIVWCKENDDKCKVIADNARMFHATYLNEKAILDYLQNILVVLKKQCGCYDYPVIPPLIARYEEECKHLQRLSHNIFSTEADTDDFLELMLTESNDRSRASIVILKAMHHFIENTSDDNQLSVCNVIFENRTGTISLCTFKNIIKLNMKNTCDKSKHMENTHEAFIGMTYINKLIELIPNFQYNFGMDSKGGMIAEHIQGKTLLQYIQSTRDFKFGDFIFILQQVCLAMQVAQLNYGFEHGDLSTWNIVINKLSVKKTFEYKVSKTKTISIRSGLVPVIIDYGKSKVHTLTKPGNDIFFLLATSLYQIISTHHLSGEDFNKVLHLANYVSGTCLRRTIFTNSKDVKKFFGFHKKYSVSKYHDKHELSMRTPMVLYNYILKKKSY